MIALAVAGGPSGRPANNRFAGLSRLMTPAFAVYAGVVFAGGLIIGWSPSARLPGPFEVGNPPRSISPEGIAAAKWMGGAVSPNRILVADNTNALLLACIRPAGADRLAGSRACRCSGSTGAGC